MKDEPTFISRCRKVREIIGVVVSYLTALDQRNLTLDSYTWHFVSREKVSGPGIDSDVFVARPIIPNVSAISFVADLGDVFIHSVFVEDSRGELTTFTLNRRVAEKHPRREICYLFFPKTIRSISMEYRSQGQGASEPYLAVFAGVARREEYLKQACWYARHADRGIESALGNPTAAAPYLEAACGNLRLAATRVIGFRMSQSW